MRQHRIRRSAQALDNSRLRVTGGGSCARIARGCATAAVALASSLFVGIAAEELLRDRSDLALVTSKASASLPAIDVPAGADTPVGVPEDSYLDRSPPRRVKTLKLVKLGWTYNCTECHQMLPARWHYDRAMVEHTNIQLKHGNNRFCLNCHHPTNRKAFVDYDGSEIAEADVVLLCAKCHGPTYRDWQAGVHGRRNGSWNTSKGSRTQLRCIECHDPHEPKFKSMQPLPPLQYPLRAAGGGAEHGGTGQRAQGH